MTGPSLYEFLKREVQRMSSVCNETCKGNIYPLIMQEVERCIILAVLEQTNHNYVATSNILGISRSKLYRKVALLSIPHKLVIPELSDDAGASK